MISTPRLILIDNGLPVATPTFVDPAHCARERSELAQCPVLTDDSLAIHTRLLRRFLAEAGARRRARRRAQKKTQATGDVACVSFCHGPSAQPPRTCSAP